MAKKQISIEKDAIVYIEWLDAFSDHNEWVNDETNIDLLLVKSVGFLHYLDNDKLVIKSHFTEKKEISQLTAIPVKWIKLVKELK